MLAIAIVDGKTMRIPNVLNFTLAMSGLVTCVYVRQISLYQALIESFAVYFVFLAIAAMYKRFRHRDGLGGGDVKFLAAACTWVGLFGIPWLLLIASLSGIVMVLSTAIFDQALGDKTRLPFGPHLALGTMIVWLYRDTLMN